VIFQAEEKIANFNSHALANTIYGFFKLQVSHLHHALATFAPRRFSTSHGSHIIR
jgi:hypothetical protein